VCGQWGDQPTGARDAAYAALKARWQAVCVRRLLRHFPSLAPHVHHVDVSTPLTIASYLRAQGGGAVGLDHVPARFSGPQVQKLLDSRVTALPGLWLTGQDTLFCGAAPGQLAGLITGLRLLGPVRAAAFIAENVLWATAAAQAGGD
jgi:all-trans-retinol 13,14-reductase